MSKRRVTALVRAFRNHVWGLLAGVPATSEAAFRAGCAAAEVEVSRVCARQDDETLALAVRVGFCVNEGFTVLFVRYGGKLAYWFTRHGWRYCRPVDQDLINDLIQELWFKLLTHGLRTYDPTTGRAFGRYLCVISHNLFVSMVLRRRQPLQLDKDYEMAVGDTVLDEVEGRETEERIRKAIADLRDDQRQVLEMTLDGRTAALIAEVLGVPIRVVYRLLFLARRALERRLGRGD